MRALLVIWRHRIHQVALGEDAKLVRVRHEDARDAHEQRARLHLAHPLHRVGDARLGGHLNVAEGWRVDVRVVQQVADSERRGVLAGRPVLLLRHGLGDLLAHVLHAQHRLDVSLLDDRKVAHLDRAHRAHALLYRVRGGDRRDRGRGRHDVGHARLAAVAFLHGEFEEIALREDARHPFWPADHEGVEATFDHVDGGAESARVGCDLMHLRRRATHHLQHRQGEVELGERHPPE
mmetsp:Transcript_19537/g.29210  ORF Transcript_19537/g.29210 Transcript_19537/m.29210 type:complete len:235 (-) Transcript_19537:14-718(-)